MKKILFATDFSKHAPVVFRYAAEIACFFKAQLVAMHVFNPPELIRTTNEDLDKLKNEVIARLKKFVVTHLPEACPNLEVDFVVNSGDAVGSILGMASKDDIDLIVMGMTGKTNAFDSFFGSSTLEVLAKTNCPLLIVPAKAKFENIDNIVFTTTFEFRDFGAINYLKKWSKALDAPIHCLHVIEDKQDEICAKKNMNILKETYKGHKMILFEMIHGDFLKEIEIYAIGKRADIVAMVTYKHHFLTRLFDGSSTKGVSKRIRIPLLVIKDSPYKLQKKNSG